MFKGNKQLSLPVYLVISDIFLEYFFQRVGPLKIDHKYEISPYFVAIIMSFHCTHLPIVERCKEGKEIFESQSQDIFNFLSFFENDFVGNYQIILG